jgi:two-component system sensor histidine kinase PhoQ
VAEVTDSLYRDKVKPLSLSKRLLLAVSIILTIFLGFTAFSLNNAFKASYDVTQHKQLKNHIYMLLTAAEFTESGTINMPTSLAEPAFSTPNSGLYAQIVDENSTVWHSDSLLGRTLTLPNIQRQQDQQQQELFSTIESGADKLLNLAYSVVWENSKGQQYDFTLHVSQDLKATEQANNEFRLNLWYWLGGTGFGLLLIQILILRWSLRPLSDVANDLQAIENGAENRLSQNYPTELNQLTRNINTLLDQEQSRRQRYKNALADLAHSLKTPLAVLQNELVANRDKVLHHRETDTQLEQIIKSIDYQLQRAATEGRTTLQAPVAISQLINKITGSLDKVYQNKQVQYQSELDSQLTLSADEGDMYELFGNILENAYKYCTSKVKTSIMSNEEHITFYVDNDGAGIPQDSQADILKRGKRMETQTEGQGLGLAIASDIVDAYQGKISLGKSKLGGACFIITLPKR